MRSLMIILLLSIGCSSTGYFNGSEYIPPSDVSNYYNMPDISSIISLTRNDMIFGMGIELFDCKRIAPEVALFEHKLGLNIAYRWTSIIETKTGVVIYYDFENDNAAYGISLSFSK